MGCLKHKIKSKSHTIYISLNSLGAQIIYEKGCLTFVFILCILCVIIVLKKHIPTFSGCHLGWYIELVFLISIKKTNKSPIGDEGK